MGDEEPPPRCSVCPPRKAGAGPELQPWPQCATRSTSKGPMVPMQLWFLLRGTIKTLHRFQWQCRCPNRAHLVSTMGRHGQGQSADFIVSMHPLGSPAVGRHRDLLAGVGTTASAPLAARSRTLGAPRQTSITLQHIGTGPPRLRLHELLSPQRMAQPAPTSSLPRAGMGCSSKSHRCQAGERTHFSPYWRITSYQLHLESTKGPLSLTEH